MSSINQPGEQNGRLAPALLQAGGVSWVVEWVGQEWGKWDGCYGASG